MAGRCSLLLFASSMPAGGFSSAGVDVALRQAGGQYAGCLLSPASPESVGKVRAIQR